MFNAKHPLLLWLLLLTVVVFAAAEFATVAGIRRANRLIGQPGTISRDAPALPLEAVFAQAYALNAQGRYMDALRLYVQIENNSGPSSQERVRYNMGSIYLQQAAQLWNDKGVWEAKQIHTLLDLAEQSLRRVLANNPEHWQARYNLEYALRIRPPAEKQEDADWQGHKSSVHAIMPGIPAGGP